MNPNRKAAYHTLGCKLNFSETSTIARQLTEAGYARVSLDDRPDVFVLNTCTVTDNADRKCREFVKRAIRRNPNVFVVVIGCYAQLKPEEIVSIPGVDLVLGAKEKFELDKYLGDLGKKEKGEFRTSNILKTRDFIPSYSIGDRTRTFLKVQDGCNYFCAFCTIPLARGRSRNASIEKTLIEANNVAKTDCKEIVLTGVNIGDFGNGTDQNFFDLVKELDVVEGINRFRISSIEPNLLSDEIIEYVAQSESFLPHFHVPLQSGSDTILKAMRRRYLTDLYRHRVEKIKTLMPNACIGVDVIVGFPGETDELFEETYNFLHELPVSYLHVFTYSERPNTTALRIDDVVPKEVRTERSKRLRILSNKKKIAFYKEFEGTNQKVLLESSNEDGFLYGFSENYVKVRVPYSEELKNSIQVLSLNKLNPEGFYEGELVLEKTLDRG